MKNGSDTLFTTLKGRIAKSIDTVTLERVVHLLWRGYILGVFENDFLNLDDVCQLEKNLGREGIAETTEMIGGPISPEEREQMAREDEEYARTGIDDSVEVPLVDELCHRINVHLEMHDHSYTVVCLWKGFLAGILETGIIDRESFDQLMAILPPGEEDQVMRELFKIE